MNHNWRSAAIGLFSEFLDILTAEMSIGLKRDKMNHLETYPAKKNIKVFLQWIGNSVLAWIFTKAENR